MNYLDQKLQRAMRGGDVGGMQEVASQAAKYGSRDIMRQAERGLREYAKAQEKAQRELVRAQRDAQRQADRQAREAERAARQQASDYKGDAIAFFTEGTGANRTVIPIKAPSGGVMKKWGKSGVLWDSNTGLPYAMDPKTRAMTQIDPDTDGQTVVKDGHVYKVVEGLPWKWVGFDPEKVGNNPALAKELAAKTADAKREADMASDKAAETRKLIADNEKAIKALEKDINLKSGDERTRIQGEIDQLKGKNKGLRERLELEQIDAHKKSAYRQEVENANDQRLADDLASRQKMAYQGDPKGGLGLQSALNRITQAQQQASSFTPIDPIASISDRISQYGLSGIPDAQQEADRMSAGLTNLWNQQSAARQKGREQALQNKATAQNLAEMEKQWASGSFDLTKLATSKDIRPEVAQKINDFMAKTGVTQIPRSWSTPEAQEARANAGQFGYYDVKLPSNFVLSKGAISTTPDEQASLWGIPMPWNAKGKPVDVGTYQFDRNGVPFIELNKDNRLSPSQISGSPLDGVKEYLPMPADWSEQFKPSKPTDFSLSMLPANQRREVMDNYKKELATYQQTAKDAWAGQKMDAERFNDTLTRWTVATPAQRQEMIAELDPRQKDIPASERRLDTRALFENGVISAQEGRLLERAFYGTDPVMPNVSEAFDDWMNNSNSKAAAKLREDLKTASTMQMPKQVGIAGFFQNLSKSVQGPIGRAVEGLVTESERSRAKWDLIDAAKREFLTEYRAENARRVDYNPAAFVELRGKLMDDKPMGAWANQTAQNFLAQAAGPMVGMASGTIQLVADTVYSRLTGNKLLTTEERDLITKQTEQSVANMDRAIQDRGGLWNIIETVTNPLSIKNTAGVMLGGADYIGAISGGKNAYQINRTLNDIQNDYDYERMTKEKLDAYQTRLTPLLNDFAAMGLQAYNRSGSKAGGIAGAIAGSDAMLSMHRAPYENSLTDSRSALAQALAGFSQTGDLAYMDMARSAALNSGGELALIKAVSDHASMGGRISPTTWGSPYLTAYRSGMVAPMTEGALELGTNIAAVLTGGTLKGIQVLGSAARAGSAMSRAGKAVAALDDLASAYNKAGLITRAPGTALTFGQNAWNTSLQAGKQILASSGGEFFQESVAAFGEAGATLGDAFNQGVQGAIFGVGMSAVHYPAGVAINQVQQLRRDAAETKALTRFVADYNKQNNTGTQLTLDVARQAQAYQSPELVRILKDQRQDLLVQQANNTQALRSLPAEPKVRPGALPITPNPRRVELLNEKARIEAGLAANLLDTAAVSESSINSAREINALPPGQREVVDAAIRAANGVPLSVSQESTLLGHRTASGKPAAYTYGDDIVLTDEFREEIKQAAPETAKAPVLRKTQAERDAELRAKYGGVFRNVGGKTVFVADKKPATPVQPATPTTPATPAPAGNLQVSNRTRYEELKRKAEGTPERQITLPDGRQSTSPARPPQPLTPAEQQEFNQLQAQLEPTTPTTPTVPVQPTTPAPAPVSQSPAPPAANQQTQPLTFTDIQFTDSPEFNPDTGKTTRSSGTAQVVSMADRQIVLVNVNGVPIPFYLSTGKAGKKNVAAGKWYPILGLDVDGWINKGSQQEISSYYGSPLLQSIAERLDNELGTTAPARKVSSKSIVDSINQGLASIGITPVSNGTSTTKSAIADNIAKLVAFADSPTTQQQQSAITTPQAPAPIQLTPPVTQNFQTPDGAQVTGTFEKQPDGSWQQTSPGAPIFTVTPENTQFFQTLEDKAAYALNPQTPDAVQPGEFGQEGYTATTPASNATNPVETPTEAAAPPLPVDDVFTQPVNRGTALLMLQTAAPWVSGAPIVVRSPRFFMRGNRVVDAKAYAELSQEERARYTPSPSPMFAHQGKVYVDETALVDYLGGVAPEARQEKLKAALREEVIHVATMNVRNRAEVIRDWQALPDAAKQRVVETYFTEELEAAGGDWTQVEVDQYQAGAEFWRMYLNAVTEGRTTEQVDMASEVASIAQTNPSFAQRIKEALQDIARWLREELLGQLDPDTRAEFEQTAAKIDAEVAKLDAMLGIMPQVATPAAEAASPMEAPVEEANAPPASAVEPAETIDTPAAPLTRLPEKAAPRNQAFVPKPARGAKKWTDRILTDLLSSVGASFGYKIVKTDLDIGIVDNWGNAVTLGTQLLDKTKEGSDVGQWIDAMNAATNPVGNEIIKNASSIGLHRVWYGHDFAANVGDVVDRFGWLGIPKYLGALLSDSTTQSGIPLPGTQFLVHAGVVGDKAATEWLSINVGEFLGLASGFVGTYMLYRSAKSGTLSKPRVIFATVGITIKLVSGVLTAQPFLILSGLADTAILITNLDQVKAAFKKGIQEFNKKPQAVRDLYERVAAPTAVAPVSQESSTPQDGREVKLPGSYPGDAGSTPAPATTLPVQPVQSVEAAPPPLPPEETTDVVTTEPTPPPLPPEPVEQADTLVEPVQQAAPTIKMAQAAKTLGVTPKELLRLVKAAVIPSQKSGNNYLFTQEALDAYAADRANKQAPILEKLAAVAGNTATEEDVADLRQRGLVDIYRGQRVINPKGYDLMAKAGMPPRLTRNQRVQEIDDQLGPEQVDDGSDIPLNPRVTRQGRLYIVQGPMGSTPAQIPITNERQAREQANRAAEQFDAREAELAALQQEQEQQAEPEGMDLEPSETDAPLIPQFYNLLVNRLRDYHTLRERGEALPESADALVTQVLAIAQRLGMENLHPGTLMLRLGRLPAGPLLRSQAEAIDAVHDVLQDGTRDIAPADLNVKTGIASPAGFTNRDSAPLSWGQMIQLGALQATPNRDGSLRVRMGRTPEQIKANAEQAEREAAEREYMDDLRGELEQITEALEGASVTGLELIDAIIAAGGFPSPNSAAAEAFQGEIKTLWESAAAMGKGAYQGEGIFRTKLFRKDAPGLDRLAESLRGHGFATFTPSDVLDLVDERFTRNRPMYGTTTDFNDGMGERAVAAKPRRSRLANPNREITPVAITRQLTGLSKREAASRIQPVLRGYQSLRGAELPFNADLQQRIGFSGKTTGKLVSYATHSLEDMELAFELPRLVETAALVESKPDKKKNPDVSAVHRLVSAVNIDGEIYPVKITVLEQRDGSLLYDAVTIKGEARVSAVQAPKGTSTATTGFNPTVLNLAKAVNLNVDKLTDSEPSGENLMAETPAAGMLQEDGIPGALPLDAATGLAESGTRPGAQPAQGAASARPVDARQGELGIPAEAAFAGIAYRPARIWGLQALADRFLQLRNSVGGQPIQPPIFRKNFATRQAAFTEAAQAAERLYRETLANVDAVYADRRGRADSLLPRLPEVRALFTDANGEVQLLGSRPVELDAGEALFAKSRRTAPHQLDLFTDNYNQTAKPWTPSWQAKEPAKVEGETPAPALALESQTEGVGRIEDFGEKLQGARKDLWQRYTDMVMAELPADARDITLAKYLPEPDYEAMIASGMEPARVAAVKALRDVIPRKPSTGYKLAAWTKMVRDLRPLIQRLIDPANPIPLDKFQLAIADSREIRDAVRFYEDLGWPHFTQAKGWKLKQSQGYVRWNGEPVAKGTIVTYMSQDYRTFPALASLDPDGNWRQGYAATLQKFRDYLDAQAAQAKEPKKIDFQIYSDTQSGDVFIGKKGASGVIRLQTGFASAKEARNWLTDHYNDLALKWEGLRQEPTLRRATNEPRTGPKRREGDVTPEMFTEAFGFRGVQFGNYVEGDRRQRDLNNAFDAFMDLSEALGIPAKALSFDGSLGLAFGARGRGGKRPAAAHYEPGQVVINLTKNSGPGSLAHEWFHALDNYFARLERSGSTAPKSIDEWATRNINAPRNARPEVMEAFRAVRNSLGGDLDKRSRAMDSTRSAPYYSQTIEKAARAFETYVIDRLGKSSVTNDYLANIDPTSEAYPRPNEMDGGIRQAFDTLFTTLDTRQGERGTMLFSKPRRQLAGGGFYLKSAEMLDSKIQGKQASLEQVKALLENPQNGIKAEELKWTGVVQEAERLAKENNGKVPKEDLLAFLAADGAVELQEDTKGANTDQNRKEIADRLRADILSDGTKMTKGIASRIDKWEATGDASVVGWLEENTGRMPSDYSSDRTTVTRYSQYTLPGGENYREVVLAMPIKSKAWQVFSVYGGDPVAAFDTEAEAKADAASRGPEFDYDSIKSDPRSYTSTHFDTPNYIAHMRLNERVDADGRPGLFIEELQSDRHQQGREKGYNEDLDVARREELRKKTGTLTDAEMQELGELNSKALGRGIPDAPFRTTWPLQLFKRALRDAVASGKDWIGWTTGETQAERFDLSKQLDAIQYDGDAIYVKRTGEAEFDAAPLAEGVPPADLEKYIGKEAAKKLMALPEVESFSEYTGPYTARTLEGENLKVGGEGMVGFYDNMVPKEVAKYVKQWGGKVEKASTPNPNYTGGRFALFSNEGTVIGHTNNLETAQKTLEKRKSEGRTGERIGENPRSGFPIWRVDITPQMRESVEDGQPLFAKARPMRDTTAELFGDETPFNLVGETLPPTAPAKPDIVVDAQAREQAFRQSGREDVGDLFEGSLFAKPRRADWPAMLERANDISVQEFAALARDGKLNEATGEPNPMEAGTGTTPISLGAAAGYPLEDIAHFYIARQLPEKFRDRAEATRLVYQVIRSAKDAAKSSTILRAFDRFAADAATEAQAEALFAKPRTGLTAPNGQPSNLTAEDHALVRTPEFKEWAGDWEFFSKRNALDTMPSVVVDSSILGEAGTESFLNSVIDIYRKLGVAQNRNKSIQFVMSGFRKLKSHSADTKTLKIIPGLKSLMESAIPLYKDSDKNGNKNIIAWHTYGARALLDGEPVFVKLVVREERNGQRVLDFFDDSTVTNEKTIRTPAFNAGPDGLFKDKLYLWWHSVNPESIKIQTDANGEPLASEVARFRQETAAESEQAPLFTKPRGRIRFDEIAKEDPKHDASRVGTAWQGKVRPTTQETNDSIDTVTPKELEKQMAMLTQFVDGVPLPKYITAFTDPAKRMRAFIKFQVGNLLALYDAFDALSSDFVIRSTHWYDGARLLAEGIRDRSNLTIEQSSAIIAVFSPMKDWFQNVAMGQRFADVMANHKNKKITKEKMAAAMREMIEAAEDKKFARLSFRLMEGKSIAQLLKDKSAEGRTLAAVAVRLMSTHAHGLTHDVLSPEGESLGTRKNLDGTSKKLVWQSYPFIEKAISIYEDGSAGNISKALGTEHKIRNFYNNIVAPQSPYGDATVDTHAVNAATLFPMGNKGYLVGLNFGKAGVAGGGNSGIYWLFHEALREAAAQRNVMPRQMQSITWEAIRGLFTDVRKRDKNFVADIAKIWQTSSNANAARTQIINLGITPPEWARMAGSDSQRQGGSRKIDGQPDDATGSVQRDLRQGRQSGDRRAGVGKPSGAVLAAKPRRTPPPLPPMEKRIEASLDAIENWNNVLRAAEEKPAGSVRKLAGEVREAMPYELWRGYQNIFRGRLDVADALAPGVKAILQAAQQEEALAQIGVNAVVDGLRRELQKAFGDPAFWSKNRSRLKEATRLLLPTASYLQPQRTGADGGFEWREFERRSGTISQVEVRKLRLRDGEWFQYDGRTYRLGDFLPDQKAFVLLEPVSVEMQQAIYEEFWQNFPEALPILDRWITPDLKDAYTVGLGSTMSVEFNREALLSFMNEWPQDLKDAFGDLLPEVPRVEGYTPDIAAQRSIIATIARLLGIYKSPGRRFKTGALREAGNVKNLVDGFSTRAMEAHREKIRMRMREGIIEKAVVLREDVPAENIGDYVALEDVFSSIVKAVEAARLLDKKAYPHLSKGLNPKDQVQLMKLVGDAARLNGIEQMVHKNVYRELMLSMARAQTEGILLRTLNFFLRGAKLGKLAAGSVGINWIGNQILTLTQAMNRMFAGITHLMVLDSRGAAVNTLEALFLLRGLITDRAPNTLNQSRIGDLIPRELFDNTTALSSLDAGTDYGNMVDDIKRNGILRGPAQGMVNAFKQGGISASILYAVHYSGGDAAVKQQSAYAAYRARAEVAANEAKVKSGRSEWMRNWIQKQVRENTAIHQEVMDAARLYFMDYANVPAWMDPSASLPEEKGKKFLKEHGLWFIKWPYNFVRFMKRMGIDGAIETFSPSSTKQERARGLANMLTIAAIAYGGAALLSGDDEEDPIIGSRFDAEGKAKDRDQDTSSRMNLSALGRKLRFGRMLASALRMAGVNINDDLTNHRGDDFWMFYQNMTWMKEGLLMGRAVRGDFKGFLRDAGAYISDLTALGILSRMVGIAKVGSIDAKKSPVNLASEAFFEALSSPINPSALTEYINNMTDPVVRRTTSNKSLDFTMGPLESIMARIPGLRKNIPVAGDPITPARLTLNFDRAGYMAREAKKIRSNEKLTPAEQDAAIQRLVNQDAMPASSSGAPIDLRNLLFGMGVDPAKVSTAGQTSRNIAGDLARLQAMGAGPESVRVFDEKLPSGETRTYITYPDPDNVAVRDPFLSLFKIATGVNIRPFPKPKSLREQQPSTLTPELMFNQPQANLTLPRQ